jgi:hypothetical protein
MLDLTGGNLVAYLRRVIEDAVNRSPRFRYTLGEVSSQYNNLIQWKDAQISIKNVTSTGNRLSPDYFMCKNYGRAILAKIQSKEGGFIEWVQEVDSTRQTPAAGVYYFNVDEVNEQTRDVDLTIQKYTWQEGKVVNAQGSIVYFAPQIDGTTVSGYVSGRGSPPTPLETAVNDGTWQTTLVSPPVPVDLLLAPHFGYLLTDTPAGLVLFAGSPPVQLTPLLDYWYQQTVQQVVCQSTVGGQEVVGIPLGLVDVPGGGSPPQMVQTLLSFTLTDQNGYELIKGKDYTYFASNDWLELSPYTPPGMTITANMVVKVDPTGVPGTNPENILQTQVTEGNSLAPGQVFVQTSLGNYTSLVPNTDGTCTLPTLLLPGEWCRWEVRVDTGRTKARAKKYNLNENVLPGLRIAIGDNVLKDDQVAIIVQPYTAETYEVYGSKENLTFTVDCRANDLQTASDLSELLRRELLIMRRTNMEADGITLFEASRSYVGLQRDLSGTAPQFVYSLTVSAMADWKVFVPLVTRLVTLEITSTATVSSYGPGISLTPRVKVFGNTKFLESYT